MGAFKTESALPSTPLRDASKVCMQGLLKHLTDDERRLKRAEEEAVRQQYLLAEESNKASYNYQFPCWLFTPLSRHGLRCFGTRL